MSWRAEVPSWDNICQVESSRSSDPESDSSSVKALGHSLAKWSYLFTTPKASESIPVCAYT